MASEAPTRERIVSAADDLFYRRGFESTSFADVAGELGISRGNFYHHFRSKDDILSAVIAKRLAETRGMLEHFEKADHPRQRIGAFVDILLRNQALIRKFGCPVGSLCTELGKLRHPSHSDARSVFSLFRTWLRQQFEQLGCRDADGLSLQLLARSQGIATIANAFDDERFLRREVRALHAWIDLGVSESRSVGLRKRPHQGQER